MPFGELEQRCLPSEPARQLVHLFPTHCLQQQVQPGGLLLKAKIKCSLSLQTLILINSFCR